MRAIVTTGQGDTDKLVFDEVPVPECAKGEVLVQVLAAGMNNTEINTRLGWYSASVTDATGDAADTGSEKSDGGWNAATPFPLIQGTDCCGRIVAASHGTDHAAFGTRVLVRPCTRSNGTASMETVWLGSDFDGAFAQFVKVLATEVFPVECDWTDAELATIPCAYGTAENMLHRAGVAAGARVLVTGASGGVGSAVVQLAKRRGAEVIGIAGEAKLDRVRAIGADRVIARDADIRAELGVESVDVVVDNVVGPGFGTMLEVLRRGGSYVSSGAIGGPVVELDMRNVYLKDLRLIGCTAWDAPVFPNLIGYIERGEIRPLLEWTFPLADIATAQRKFLEKSHVGKYALIPPPLDM